MSIEKRKLYITVLACASVQLCGGIIYLWSVFRKPAVDYFCWNDSAANMVSAFMLFGFVLGNLLGGLIQDKTNPRLTAFIGVSVMSTGIFFTSLLTPSSVGLIYLTYCALGGVGSGFTYASVVACLQKWFPKKRGLASGIAVASFALSTVIFAPLISLMLKLDSFGSDALPKTFLIIGVTFFAVGNILCIFISQPKNRIATEITPAGHDKAYEETIKTSSLTPRQALRSLPFLCIVFTTFFGNATWNIILPLIKDLGTSERGLSDELAILTVTVTGIANCGGRFVSALASDKINRAYVLIALSAITLLCAFAMTGASGYFYILVVCVAAFSYGGPASVFPAMTVELCGTKHMGANYGIVLLGLGFSSVTFNYLSNLLIELSGAYVLSFLLAALTAIISIALLVLCAISLNRKRNPSRTKPEMNK